MGFTPLARHRDTTQQNRSTLTLKTTGGSGLGVLNALWLPVLDLSFELQNWGLVVRAPNDFPRPGHVARCSLRFRTPTPALAPH